jgi:general secretion pathway protein E
VEPFLLASTLRAVIAQRLVRRLCPACRTSEPADATLAARLGVKPGTPVAQPVGCEECRGTGFRGRIGVFEVVRVDDIVRRLINEGGDEEAIAKHVFAESDTLAEAARKLVLAGETTPEEAIRIAREEVVAESEPATDDG